MDSTALRILSGKHAGAIVSLVADKSWSIGCSEHADILLLDEEVEPLHARLAWASDEGVWQMTATANEVRVFDYLLKPGAVAALMPGSCFAIGGVAFDLATAVGVAESGRVVTHTNTKDAEQIARMRFLRHAHPWRYGVTVMRSMLQPRYMLAATCVIVGSAAIVAVLLTRPDLSVEYLEGAGVEISKLYPNVSHDVDRITGITTYKGYVNDQRELGALRQLALRANYGAVVMDVLPMDVLALNVASTMETYYSSPRVSVIGPGEIEVNVLSEDAIKNLAGWNLPAIEARVLHELPELKMIKLQLKQSALPSVSVPLDRLGFSVISASSGEPFVVNQHGERLFNGAQVKEGRLNSIDLCQVKLTSTSDETIFDMHVQNDRTNHCK